MALHKSDENGLMLLATAFAIYYLFIQPAQAAQGSTVTQTPTPTVPINLNG